MSKEVQTPAGRKELLEEAYSSYGRAVMQESDNPDTYEKVAQAFVKIDENYPNDYQKDWLRKCASQSYFQAGALHLSAGNHSSAVDNFSKSLEFGKGEVTKRYLNACTHLIACHAHLSQSSSAHDQEKATEALSSLLRGFAATHERDANATTDKVERFLPLRDRSSFDDFVTNVPVLIHNVREEEKSQIEPIVPIIEGHLSLLKYANPFAGYGAVEEVIKNINSLLPRVSQSQERVESPTLSVGGDAHNVGITAPAPAKSPMLG